jgi:hypothetical protein
MSINEVECQPVQDDLAGVKLPINQWFLSDDCEAFCATEKFALNHNLSKELLNIFSFLDHTKTNKC